MTAFSIITVTRNNLAGLKNTAESLHWQICRDFEWIIIDGASDDGTLNYLKTLNPFPTTPGETNPPGIPAWVSEADSGIYDAMNKGIDRARGDYVLFLNAGDQLATPETLYALDLMLEGEDFIYGDSLESGHQKPARSHEHHRLGMFTHHQSMLYRRAVLGDLRYDTGYRIAADYKFTLEFMKRTQTRLYAPIPVCIFEPGGLSQNHTGLGRREQFRARRETATTPLPANIAVFVLQGFWMTLRRNCPGVYWWLKKHI